jgi:hypothetical protein
MKVRVLRIRQPDETKTDRWITEGQQYDVLGVEVTGGKVYFRVESDQGTPALFESELFELVDGAIPSSWIAVAGTRGGFSLDAKAWARQGFWEAFFDREPEAMKLYEAEKRSMRGDK